MRSGHLINEQVINLHLNSSAEASRVQREVRDFYFDQLLPLIENIFDELSGPGELLVLDSLELDIGQLSEFKLSDKLIALIREKLVSQVMALREKQEQQPAWALPSNNAVSQNEPLRPTSEEEARTMTIIHFLETGQLPWWYDFEDGVLETGKVILELLGKAPVAFIQELQRLRGNTDVFRRLALQLEEKTFKQLVLLLGGDSKPAETKKRMQQVMALFTRPAFTNIPEYETKAWLLAALTEIQASGSTPEEEIILLAALVKTWPAYFAPEIEQPYQFIYEQATVAGKAEAKIFTTPVLTLLLQLEKQGGVAPVFIGNKKALQFFFVNEDFTAEAKNAWQRWLEQEPVIARIPASAEALFQLFTVYTSWTTEEIAAVARYLVQQAAAAETRSAIAAAVEIPPVVLKAETKALLELLIGTKPLPAAAVPVLTELIKKTAGGNLPAENSSAKKNTSEIGSPDHTGKTKTETAEESQAPASKAGSRRQTKKGRGKLAMPDTVSETAQVKAVPELPPGLVKEPEKTVLNYAPFPEQGLRTDYAGLVLVAPFLPAFFRVLELTDGKSFADTRAAHRAVFLLHYLATRKTKAEEQELHLHKILCGLEHTTPLPRSMKLSRSEKEHAEELLSEIAQRWERLRTSSGAMVRNSFFSRKGRITTTDSGFLLRVERTAIDLLIDTLPWSLSIIKAPWMKRMLQTEW